MSVILANSAMTLMEAHKREGFDDSAAVLGELQSMIDFLDECPVYPASHVGFNKQLQATRLGKGGFVKANGPVALMTSGSEEITEPVKMYEGDSAVDEKVLVNVQDPYGVRDSEDTMNLEGIFQDWIYQLFYNNEADTPDGFKSLTRRRPSIVANRCWDADGTGSDLCSMWVFEFSRRGFYLVHDGLEGQGSGPMLKNEDRGRHLVTVPVGTGNMWAWMRHYAIHAGMVLRDDRALQRYANIESAGGTGGFDAADFILLKNQLPSVGRNAVAFCNRDLKGQLDNIAYVKSNVWMSLREVQSYGPITFVADVPIRMVEPLLSTETELT